MNRLVNLLILDLKKPKEIRNLIIIILIIIIITILFSLMENNIEVASMELNKFLPYVLLFSTFLSLGSEFENNTDRIIFSASFSRNEVIVSKLVGIIIKGIIISIIYIIFSVLWNLIYSVNFELKYYVNFIITFIVYSFTIGTVNIFISIITGSSKVTGIVIYILFFDLMNALLANALISKKLSQDLKWIILNSPLYAANKGVVLGVYSFWQFTFMILLGLILMTISTLILKRKDI